MASRIAVVEDEADILETLIGMTTRELQAERGSLFLNDSQSGELYSVVAQGELKRRIRILNTSGIAGQRSGFGNLTDE